jgi:hypothetical protein
MAALIGAVAMSEMSANAAVRFGVSVKLSPPVVIKTPVVYAVPVARSRWLWLKPFHPVRAWIMSGCPAIGRMFRPVVFGCLVPGTIIRLM